MKNVSRKPKCLEDSLLCIFAKKSVLKHRNYVLRLVLFISTNAPLIVRYKVNFPLEGRYGKSDCETED
jgi:hypothetical protein